MRTRLTDCVMQIHSDTALPALGSRSCNFFSCLKAKPKLPEDERRRLELHHTTNTVQLWELTYARSPRPAYLSRPP